MLGCTRVYHKNNQAGGNCMGAGGMGAHKNNLVKTQVKQKKHGKMIVS